jgi:hypothetical protein
MEVGYPGSLSRYGINLVIKKINGTSGYSSHNLLVLIGIDILKIGVFVYSDIA